MVSGNLSAATADAKKKENKMECFIKQMKVIRFDGWTLQKVTAISTDFDSVPQ